jgi:hypothetical protein
MRFRHLLAAGAAALIAACSTSQEGGGSARSAIGDGLHAQRLLVAENPPLIAAATPEEIALARLQAGRLDIQRFARAPQSQWITVDSLPFLTSTGAGRQFLASPAPRALARGTPEEICPALSMSAGPAIAAPSPEVAAAARAEAAVEALSRCMAQLPPGETVCGCRVVALDGMVTVPREQTVYATGTSARMRAPSLGIDLLLVAEDGPDGQTLLRDLSGTVAWLTHGPGNAVTLRLENGGREFRGASIPVGFRRGRLAERIYATDKDGTRLSLLIGFGPDELAQSAGAWLAWPGGG